MSLALMCIRAIRLTFSTHTAPFWDKIPNDDRSRFNTVMSMLDHGGGAEPGMMNVIGRPLEGRSTPVEFHDRWRKVRAVSEWVTENCKSLDYSIRRGVTHLQSTLEHLARKSTRPTLTELRPGRRLVS